MVLQEFTTVEGERKVDARSRLFRSVHSAFLKLRCIQMSPYGAFQCRRGILQVDLFRRVSHRIHNVDHRAVDHRAVEGFTSSLERFSLEPAA